MNSHALYPTGNGATASWTATGAGSPAACVDEPSLSNGDTDYIVTGSAAAIHLFTFADPRPQVCTPKRVEVFARVKDPSSTVEAIQLCIRVGTTNYFSANQPTDGNAYEEFRHTWSTNPNGGVAWTWDAVAGLQFGVKSINVGGGYGGDPRCSQLQLIVYCNSAG